MPEGNLTNEERRLLAQVRQEGNAGVLDDVEGLPHEERCQRRFWYDGSGPRCSLPREHAGLCRYKCADPDCPGEEMPASLLPHACGTTGAPEETVAPGFLGGLWHEVQRAWGEPGDRPMSTWEFHETSKEHTWTEGSE